MYAAKTSLQSRGPDSFRIRPKAGFGARLPRPKGPRFAARPGAAETCWAERPVPFARGRPPRGRPGRE